MGDGCDEKMKVVIFLEDCLTGQFDNWTLPDITKESKF